MNCPLLVCSLLMAALVVGTIGVSVMLFIAALNAHNSTISDDTTEKPSRFRVGDEAYYKHKLGLSDTEIADDELDDIEIATDVVDDKVREARGQHKCRTAVTTVTLKSNNQTVHGIDIGKETTDINNTTVVSTLKSENETDSIAHKAGKKKADLGAFVTTRDEVQQHIGIINSTAVTKNATLRQDNEIISIEHTLAERRQETTVSTITGTENETITFNQEVIQSSNEITTSFTISSSPVVRLLTERHAVGQLDVGLPNKIALSNTTVQLDNRTVSTDEVGRPISTTVGTTSLISDNETVSVVQLYVTLIDDTTSSNISMFESDNETGFNGFILGQTNAVYTSSTTISLKLDNETVANEYTTGSGGLKNDELVTSR